MINIKKNKGEQLLLHLNRAFTLLELVIVIALLGILMVLMVPSFRQIIPKAHEVVCISHLRGLWLGFSPCSTDGTGWPQVPASIQIGSRAEQQWWIDTASERFGIDHKLWVCPSIKKLLGAPNATNGVPLIDYMPTLFDPNPSTPNKWAAMPWFIEIANSHGRGCLMVLPDGSIGPAPR